MISALKWAMMRAVLMLGLNQIYSYIMIIRSTNKYRKHKSNMLI